MGFETAAGHKELSDRNPALLVKATWRRFTEDGESLAVSKALEEWGKDRNKQARLWMLPAGLGLSIEAQGAVKAKEATRSALVAAAFAAGPGALAFGPTEGGPMRRRSSPPASQRRMPPEAQRRIDACLTRLVRGARPAAQVAALGKLLRGQRGADRQLIAGLLLRLRQKVAEAGARFAVRCLAAAGLEGHRCTLAQLCEAVLPAPVKREALWWHELTAADGPKGPGEGEVH